MPKFLFDKSSEMDSGASVTENLFETEDKTSTSTFFTIGAFLVIIFLYKLSTKNFKYWKQRCVPYVEPLPFFGNFWEVFTFRYQIGHYLAQLYNHFQTPYFGIYIFNKPHLVVKDPELIKTILVKDFNYFTDHNIVSDVQCDAIASNFLFFLKNPKWKTVRAKISPGFNAGKLKLMMDEVNHVCNDLKEYVEKRIENDIEAKDISDKFTADIIAICAYGIQANCFKYEDAEFRKLGKTIFKFSLKTSLCQIFYFIVPSAVKLFKLPFFDPFFNCFMRKVFWEIFNKRKVTGQKRNDIIDVLMQIKEKKELEFDDNTLIAQAAQFFAAGFETVSAIMSFALYELSLNVVIQHKARTEVKSALLKHETITYEALVDMPYLKQILYETLRKYPAFPFLDRTCVRDYKIPNSNYTVETGTPILIPLLGLHYDTHFFSNPEKFDPERFSDGYKEAFPEYSYLPFGKGLRSCIGERFGFSAIAIAIAQILSEFKIESSVKTPVPLVYETKGFLLASKYGLYMTFKKLSNR